MKTPKQLSAEHAENPGRILVVVTKSRPGGNDHVSDALIDHAKTLSPRGWKGIGRSITRDLRKRGYNAKLRKKPIKRSKYGCDEKLDVSPDHLPTERCKKNMGKALKASKELRINLSVHGFARGRYREVDLPRGYPYAGCSIAVGMIDLRTGEHLWVTPVKLGKQVSENVNWNNPPYYPELTLAYYQVTRDCADAARKLIKANVDEE